MREIQEHEAERIIQGLEKGEQQTLLVDGIETTYRKLDAPPPACKRHYFEFDGRHDDQHDCYKCNRCPNGRIIDRIKFQVKNGQIVSRDG